MAAENTATFRKSLSAVDFRSDAAINSSAQARRDYALRRGFVSPYQDLVVERSRKYQVDRARRRKLAIIAGTTQEFETKEFLQFNKDVLGADTLTTQSIETPIQALLKSRKNGRLIPLPAGLDDYSDPKKFTADVFLTIVMEEGFFPRVAYSRVHQRTGNLTVAIFDVQGESARYVSGGSHMPLHEFGAEMSDLTRVATQTS